MMTILARKLLLTTIFLFTFLYEIKATDVFQGTCPDGSWKKYLSSKCFKLIDTAAGWNAGSASCQALQPQFKSRISYLKTKEEQNFVNNYLFKELTTLLTSVWIGAKRDGGNNWAWDDGESVSAEDWDVGYPSADRLSGCVQIDHNSDMGSGTWQDAKCVESRFVLCEAQQELTLSDVVQMLLQAQSDLIKVKENYNILDRKHTELQQEFRGLQIEYDELSNKVDGNLDNLIAKDTDHDTKIATLTAKDIDLQGQVDDLSAKEIILQQEWDVLVVKDTDHDTKIGELVTRDGELQAAIDLLGSVPADLDTTLTNLKNADTQHDTKIGELGAADIELQRQIGLVPNDLASTLTSLKNKDTDHDTKIGDLVIKDEDLQSQIDALGTDGSSTPPIGAVYVTYKSQDSEPKDLWPNTEWKENICVDTIASLKCWVRRS